MTRAGEVLPDGYARATIFAFLAEQDEPVSVAEIAVGTGLEPRLVRHHVRPQRGIDLVREPDAEIPAGALVCVGMRDGRIGDRGKAIRLWVLS